MSLHARVQAFMDGSGESFDALACDIARRQAPHLGGLYRDVHFARADDIPAVPTDAFRLRRIAGDHPDERVFRTSGTTSGARGEHPMRTTATYAKGALMWAKKFLWPEGVDFAFVGLIDPAPDSSLSFMLELFAERLSGPSSFGVRTSFDVPSQRTLVAGTSFAFVHLCDAGVRLPLPKGSRVMQTGGFKGKSREVASDALRKNIAHVFDIPEEMVVGEYGMTELSSQLYQRDERYHPPPWLRVSAVDPETLAATTGRGIARMVDLANVDSAVAIQTADVITPHADGSIELHGRLVGATPRGCSLAIEHLIA